MNDKRFDEMMGNPMAAIEELIVEVHKVVNKTNRLRQAFMADYCLNGTPDDDCRVCEFARSASYGQMQAKHLQWQEEKEIIAEEHLMGEDPGVSCSDYPAEYMGGQDWGEYTSQPF